MITSGAPNQFTNKLQKSCLRIASGLYLHLCFRVICKSMNIYLLTYVYLHFLGSLFNSHHPGPRRVWKVGSEQQLLSPFPEDPEDSADSRENSETFSFEHLSVTFGHLACGAPPWKLDFC